MKTEFVDVSETRKNLNVEIPSTQVDAEIDRITRTYSKAARIPGFRPGKVPQRLVRQRFREQILHDVAHELIPRAVDDALRAKGVEPVDTPDIRDVVVEEGQPLKFTATFETVPPIEPGDCHEIRLTRKSAEVSDQSVEEALEQLRQRAARFEPVEDRGIGAGDNVVVDLSRQTAGSEQADTHDNVSVEVGAAVNPPGFDQELTGMQVGEKKSFDVQYPGDYAIAELAGTTVHYTVSVKTIRRRVVPALDDEFAKDLGEFVTLDDLRARVRGDLQQNAEQDADRQVRADLMKQLAGRVAFDVPEALVEREIDRRIEDFVRRLLEQQVDPRRTNIDWEEMRKSQREPALESVRAALVLDEVSRREGLAVTEAEVEQEVSRYAERTGRTTTAVRAQLEKEGAISRLYAGLRREKAVDFLLACATIDRT
ncbi:MAG: trigger factor [Bacteroidales bacterium]